MKTLLRNNNATSESEVLSDSEFTKVALENIAAKALKLANSTNNESKDLLDTFSDILELSNAVLLKENINPLNLMTHAQEMRSELGTFMDKKADKE